MLVKHAMRWPLMRHRSDVHLVFSWSEQSLTYLLARVRPEGGYQVLKAGIEHQGSADLLAFCNRLSGLGLKGQQAQALLRPAQYQFLQIDAPAVAPEELRSAARFQVRGMLEGAPDDFTLDVMRVGDGQKKGLGFLFVAAAPHQAVRSVLSLSDAMQWGLRVIDVQETAQRNLQSALAGRTGRADRANLALVFGEDRQVLLTISANEELFYSRRLDLPDAFFTEPWLQLDGISHPANAPTAQRFVVDIQRSLDVWSRSWSTMLLDGVRVYAAERTQDVANWLAKELGMPVEPLPVQDLFPGFESLDPADQLRCLPLLGLLLRVETRAL